MKSEAQEWLDYIEADRLRKNIESATDDEILWLKRYERKLKRKQDYVTGLRMQWRQGEQTEREAA